MVFICKTSSTYYIYLFYKTSICWKIKQSETFRELKMLKQVVCKKQIKKNKNPVICLK